MVSLLGENVSLQHNLVAQDITTSGMYRKSWVRIDSLYLYKSDRTNDFANTKAEYDVSCLLDCSNVKHVRYELVEFEGLACCRCKCISDDDVSLVDVEYIKQWCAHMKKDFLSFVRATCLSDFAKMVVVDYVFANTDRHINNWGFLVSNDSNEIIGMAPLFDHNQALLAIELGNSIDDLVYEPTGKSMLESAMDYFPFSEIEFCTLPVRYEKRLHRLQRSSANLSTLSAF